MLKKLSLAALVALGSVSTLSAQPLTEAIQNVKVAGYTKLQAYFDSNVDYYKTKYKTEALFKFAVPVSDTITFKSAYLFKWDITGKKRKIKNNETLTDGFAQLTNGKFFLQYSNGALTGLFGKIPVPTPVTGSGVGEATGAGAIALLKANGATFVAAALDDLVGVDINNALKTLHKSNSNVPEKVGGNNTYALAGIFGNEMLKAQAWAFKVNNIINYDIVLMATAKVAEGVSADVKFATAKLDKSISDKTQTYFNIAAKYASNGADATVGFIKTGKDGGTVTLDEDAPLVRVIPTEQHDNIANSADDYALYAKAGYSVDAKTNAYISAAKADKAFNYEVVAGCDHKYTNKFKIHTYVSQASAKNAKTKKDENNLEVSAAFTYSF